MKKQAIILQGWPQKKTQHWYPWLKQELEIADYKVDLPDLPTMQTGNPNMQIQLDYIEDLVSFSDNLSIIGHSLGSPLAMRLAEKNKYDKMVLVAGFDFDDLTEGLESFWKNKIDHSEIIANTNKRIVVHSDNDPYITKLIAKEMAKRLQADFVLIPSGGHFMEDEGWKEFPALLKAVL